MSILTCPSLFRVYTIPNKIKHAWSNIKILQQVNPIEKIYLNITDRLTKVIKIKMKIEAIFPKNKLIFLSVIFGMNFFTK